MTRKYLWLVGAWFLFGCPKEEICNNNVDDDGNGQSDCFDDACSAFSGCPRCGDATVDPGEQCDGQNLNNQTCTTLGQDDGTLACNAACQFDLSGCVQNIVCGDGFIDAGEECDGQNLAGETCETLGEGGGTLACVDSGQANECTFDTSGCVQGVVCGNSLIEAGEECDDGNQNNGDGCDQNCQNENVGNGALVINEVDYDQFNTDAASFVEIFNGSGAAINLTGFALVFINGAAGVNSEYGRVDLSSAGSLNNGQFLVVGNDAIVNNLGGNIKTIGQGTTDFLQNAGNAANPASDGILLINAQNQVLDSFAYEGNIANGILDPGGADLNVNFTDTGFTGEDTNDDLNSIARLPNGVDTNNNNNDWALTTTITPGATNQ